MFSVSGAEFDAGAVPEGAAHLVIHQIRKGDVKRLAGLQALPVKRLELRWLSARDLTAVPLPAGLEELEIWQSRAVTSLDGIAQAKGLRRLRWAENGPLADGRALRDLPMLSALEVEGGMASKQKLTDLEFLRGLDLRTLALDGIAPHDLDIAPLLALGGPIAVQLNGLDWNEGSLAALAARFPDVLDDVLRMEDYPADMGMRCAKCGGVRQMLRIRKRRFLWCAGCDAKGLARVLDGFRAQVEAARQAGIRSVSGG